MVTKINLITVCKTTHTTHDTKDIVVGGVDTDLSGGISSNSIGGKDKLKSSVVNSGHIASSRWLVLLRAECERVNVDSGVWVASVVLVWLNKVEVGTFTLRKAILSVKLKFGSNNRVLSPAVQVKSGLGKNEGTGIRNTRVRDVLTGNGSSLQGQCRLVTICLLSNRRLTLS